MLVERGIGVIGLAVIVALPTVVVDPAAAGPVAK